ncbi:MAG: hypothetical protein ACYCYM_10830 [Saccharofermentanales bacterium]
MAVSEKHKIEILQVMRACAALVVFSQHMIDTYNINVSISGRFGVAVFLL